jgi:hypothetical protein
MLEFNSWEEDEYTRARRQFCEKYLETGCGQSRATVDANSISLDLDLQPRIEGALENDLKSLVGTVIKLLPGDWQHELGKAVFVLGRSSRPFPEKMSICSHFTLLILGHKNMIEDEARP